MHFLSVKNLIVSGLFLLAAAGCEKKTAVTPTPNPPVVQPPAVPSQVAAWITNSNRSALFERQRLPLNFAAPAANNQNTTITLDTTQRYQAIDGFGYSLTQGSALVLKRMSAAARTKLLRELFGTDSTYIGVSYLRLTIGASDLNSTVYTYAETPGDVNLTSFSLAPDQAEVIPMLKEILTINPNIKIMGSPWTAPVWMKDNNAYVGGSLQPQYYAAYARYFVKYVQEMAAQGIRIDAITPQNEPLYGGNNPSMVMTGTQQATFIRDHLGPAFAAAAITTKIVAYDHNPDAAGLAYVNTVLSDPGASAYTDGSAFHLYGGSIEGLTQIHNSFPTKNIYFTEQWTDANARFEDAFPNDLQRLVIGSTRNWSRNVLQWNLAADPQQNPHTPGGCDRCLGAVTIGGDVVTRNPAYYVIAHASKLVRPGSVRIETNLPGSLPNVAFQRPDGKKVLIVLNTNATAQTFNIGYRGKVVSPLLYGSSVGTYIW